METEVYVNLISHVAQIRETKLIKQHAAGLTEAPHGWDLSVVYKNEARLPPAVQTMYNIITFLRGMRGNLGKHIRLQTASLQYEIFCILCISFYLANSSLTEDFTVLHRDCSSEQHCQKSAPNRHSNPRSWCEAHHRGDSSVREGTVGERLVMDVCDDGQSSRVRLLTGRLYLLLWQQVAELTWKIIRWHQGQCTAPGWWL